MIFWREGAEPATHQAAGKSSSSLQIGREMVKLFLWLWADRAAGATGSVATFLL